jgi:hypothetical protein
MTKKKYEHLVLSNPINQHRPSEPMNSPFLAGSPDFWKKIGGAMGQFAFYYIMRTGMFAEGPHYHHAEEYLMFISSNPHDMKNLGATVEIAFGPKWEKYTFSTSCFVRFPIGVEHCPVNIARLDRPFLFGHYWPAGEPAHFIPARMGEESAKAGAPV